MTEGVRTYLERPNVVEAIRHDGTLTKHLRAFLGGLPWFVREGHVVLPTREGDQSAHAGDYLVKGRDGCVRVVAPEAFQSSYDEVSPDA